MLIKNVNYKIHLPIYMQQYILFKNNFKVPIGTFTNIKVNKNII